MADSTTSWSRRMCSMPERLQLHLAMLALQFGYAGFHVVSRAALNMGISKLVFPVYRNIIALLLLAPFAFFLEKYTKLLTFNFPQTHHLPMLLPLTFPCFLVHDIGKRGQLLRCHLYSSSSSSRFAGKKTCARKSRMSWLLFGF